MKKRSGPEKTNGIYHQQKKKNDSIIVRIHTDRRERERGVDNQTGKET